MASNIFRASPGRLRSDSFVKKYKNAATPSIAAGFWTLTVNITHYLSLTIKNALGQLLTTATINYAVFEYYSGSPLNFGWMTLTQTGVGLTDGSGTLTILYRGTTPTGGIVYVSIFQPTVSPTESATWAVTIS